VARASSRLDPYLGTFSPTYTVSDPNLKEGPTQAFNVVWANMAVRKEVFDSGHRFCSSIGPRGKSYPMGSETEFVRRMVALGMRVGTHLRLS